jgi:hypothetical protein
MTTQLDRKPADATAASRRVVALPGGGRLPVGVRIFGGVLCVLLMCAALAPMQWYLNAVNAPPYRLVFPIGVLLLKFCFGAEALFCLALSKSKSPFGGVAPGQRAFADTEPDADSSGAAVPFADISARTATICLIAITMLSASLRLWQSNNGLWLDELTPLSYYRHFSILQLLTIYGSTNNHLLYTILEKGLIQLLGESEWVVRLPAVALGVATVPLMYALARSAMNRFSSLACALLLATSFHHIFFSQNARGYSAFVFFTLCATVFLLRALQKDRARDWILYVVSMVLSVAFLLGPSIAVISAHLFLGVGCLKAVADRGESMRPLLLRLSSIFGLTILLMLHLYSVAFPQAIWVLETTYKHASTGFSLCSLDFVQETARGLFGNYGVMLLAGLVPAATVMIAGFSSLWRKNWFLVGALILPLILLGGFMGVLSLEVSPRFFILALPAAILIGVEGLGIACHYVSKLVKRPSIATPMFSVVVSLLLVGAVPSLLRYYALPKQDFKGALQYMNSVRRPDQVLMPIYTAEGGFEYYADRMGLKPDVDYFVARDQDRFESVLAHRRPEQVLILTTFRRALHIDHPELERLIAKDWHVDRVFPGTIGDGAVTVWSAAALGNGN